MVLKQPNIFNFAFFHQTSLKNSSIALLFKDFLPRLTKKDCAKICYLISAPFLSIIEDNLQDLLRASFDILYQKHLPHWA